MDPLEEYLVRNQSERTTSIFLKIVQESSSVRVINLFGDSEIYDFLKGIGRLFYVISPSETSFKDPRDVPPYFADVS